jgi:uncharacterized protein DUF349
MAILDRFRTQTRHKHPDAAVRLAFVQEVPLDERDLLIEIAREDTDPRVRRAAVAKLMDPAALAGVAKDDADEQVRAQAVGMLRDIALEAFEGVGETESHAAVDAIADMKTIVGIAKNASRESTAQRAAARVTEPHALGSIARHAEHEPVRLQAFDAIQDHAEILKTALNCEFRDPTLAAVERISDRGELDQIAARARNKSASKRARAIVREMDEREAAERDALKSAAAAEAVEAAAAAAAEAANAARAAELARADAEAVARRAREAEEAERRAAEDADAARLRAEQEAADRARAEAAEEAARQDKERRLGRLAELAGAAGVSAAVEDLGAARRQFAAIRKEWQTLSAAVEIDPAIAAQYADAERAFASRDEAAREADERARREALTRLQQLASRVEATAGRTDLSLKAGERAVKELRTALGTIPQLPSKKDYEEIVKRLKAAQTALTPKVQELRDIADWQRWANVGIQEQLCEKMEGLKALDDPEAIAKQVRELQQQWRQAADVPRAQGEALWKRFKAAHDEAWAKCEAHFAEQAVARNENLAKKVALCDRAEALAESTNWIRTADEIKTLQAEWKTIGPVTRGQEKAVWERFRAACDRFFTRRHADLAERKKVWGENLGKKEALIARAEALQDSTDWDAAATEIKQLQGEWKNVGPVKKSRSEALWQRFRGACDHFFSRYAQRHDITKGERAAAREAIVAELEGLAGPAPEPPRTDAPSEAGSPETATEPQAVELQSAEPQSGEPAPAEAPSAEPRSAEPQSAVPVPQSLEPPADLVARVRSIRGRWQSELAARGVDRDRAAQLDARFAAAFARVVSAYPAVFAGTDLDPDANRKRMESIVQRMEDLAKSLAGPTAAAADASLSPTTRLAAMLKEALAANTIGGRVDDDSRFRAANEEVRQAQASWSRVGPVPDDTRRALADRFQRAIRRISDAAAVHARGAAAVVGSGGPGRTR